MGTREARKLRGIVNELISAQRYAAEVGAGDSISAALQVAQVRLEREEAKK